MLTQPIQALAGALLHFLWQGALIALLVALAMACIKSADSRSRHAVALGGLLLSGVTFLATLLFGLFSGQAPLEGLAPTYLGLAEIPLDDLVTQFSESSRASTARLLLVLSWSGGVLLMALRFRRGHGFARQLRRNAYTPSDRKWQAMLDTLRQDLGLDRAVRLLQSASLESPAVVGWMQPVILVPISCLTLLTPDQLRSVLAHELAHIKRHDHLANALMTLVETTLFFHPATWWLAKFVRDEREHCCDELAVDATGSARPLAEALTELEALRITNPSPVMAARNQGSPLLSRIKRILRMNPQIQTPGGALRIRTTFAIASLLAGIGLIQPAVAEDAPTEALSWSLESTQDPRSDYAIVERRIEAAVKAGLLSKDDAKRTLEAVANAMKGKNKERESDTKPRLEDIQRKVRQAVADGKLSREDARKKMTEIRDKWVLEETQQPAPTNSERYAKVERELKAAVESGRISKDDAKRRLVEFRMSLGAERRSEATPTANERERYAKAERELKAAVESGRISKEDAKRRISGMRERLAGETSERSAAPEPTPREIYTNAAKELRGAVKAGKLSREDAQKKLAMLKERLIAKKKSSEREPPNPREIYADAEKKVRAAVMAGDITREDAKKRLESLRERLWGKREGQRKERSPR
ncbi:MAG: beta-lactamase regulating signal transducer with metallopeptidase domain [Planctomycetota bacterium]|jgi:beta-lactamase regulating signal transducer with metallopeptidase domain/polyhydroxyalkanoate synthesis regulator phasin